MWAARLGCRRCCCSLLLPRPQPAARRHLAIRVCAASGAHHRPPPPPAPVSSAGSRPSRLAARQAAAPGGEQAPQEDPIAEELQRLGLPRLQPGQHVSLLCPKCRGGRTEERALAVLVKEDGFTYNCFRATCGWHGGFSASEALRRAAFDRPQLELAPLSPAWLAFFAQRGISAATLQRNGVQQLGSRQPGQEPAPVVFPYRRDGELVNVKYRTLEKRMWQHKNAEKILFGWDDIRGAAEILIVEGEMDKLALEEAGFRAVVSVPNGAPARVRSGRLPSRWEDRAFSYVWDSQPVLEQASRILLATDCDGPGRVLAEELARRLGPERCWLVTWQLPQQQQAPSQPQQQQASLQQQLLQLQLQRRQTRRQQRLKTVELQLPQQQQQQQQQPAQGSPAGAGADAAEKRIKDANDVLMAAGPAAVQACVRAAIPYPVPGLTSVASLAPTLLQEHARGLPPVLGLRAGWKQLDALYATRPGCVTVLAGPPGAGKTGLALDLLLRLAGQHEDFRSGLCLFDNQAPKDVLRTLLERRCGKPFAAGQPGRMSQGEAQAGLDWLAARFALVHPAERSRPHSLEECLEMARIAAARDGLRGLLIDSAQALAPGLATVDAAVAAMRELRAFAQAHNLHVWLTAHTLAGDSADLLLRLADAGLVLHRTPTGGTLTVHASNRECARPGTVAFAVQGPARLIVPQ